LTLLDVFNAGIRPYSVSLNRCEIDQASLSFALPEGKSTGVVDVRHASFAVDRRDRIRRIEISTPAVSVQEAVDILSRLGAALGITLTGLQEAMARATPNNPKWSEPWIQDWSNPWADARLGFEPMTYFSNDTSTGNREMRAIVHFTFEWKSNEVGPTFRRVPIQAPKGYEHVSMEIPNHELLKRVHGSSDPAYAHLQIKPPPSGAPAPSAKEAPGVPENTHPEPITAPPAPVAPTLAKSSNLFWWIVGAIAALVAVVWVVRRKKPKA
jgi:hypothetical protein